MRQKVILEKGGNEKEMCSYLGAETVAVDAAKPRRRTKRILLATGFVALLAPVLLAGCSGVTVDLGSNTQGGKLTGNDTPVVQEITWVDVTVDDLIANYQQYIGKEVFVRNTIMVSKSTDSFMVGGGRIKAFPHDLTFVNYLAVTDTVEVRGVVTGIDQDGVVIIENAHVNVWFSCYPREHTGNDDIGNDRPVQSDTNGIPASGWPGT
jgi:hypothetical protein